MSEWHDDKQKYFSPYGFCSPVGKCKNSSFASNAHRVALFPIEFREDGIKGYTVQRRCVNCGKWLGMRMFRISERDPLSDKCIETDGKES